MTSIQKSSKVLQMGSSRSARTLRCLLLLVAWQAPVPWVHCHGTLASSTSATPSWLVSHLASYHATVAPYSPGFLGWHWHADFLGGSHEAPDQPTRPEQDRLPLTKPVDSWADSLAHGTAPASLSPAMPCHLQQVEQARVIRLKSGCSAHFFAAVAPSIPLTLRFCIARC